MAGINYRRLQQTMKRLSTDNGKTVTLTRPGKTERVNGKDVITPSVSKDLIMVETKFTFEEQQSGRIQTGDIILATSSTFPIMIGDRLDVDGISYRVEKPGKIKPGMIVIGYRVWARL